jgi:3-dehydroquinate synthase class II
VGGALLVEAEGLLPGVEARLVLSGAASAAPQAYADLGPLHLDAARVHADLRLEPDSTRAVFELPAVPAGGQLAFVVCQRSGGEVARSKTALVRVRQEVRRLPAAPRAWRLPEGHVHSGSCCGLR